MSKSDFFDQSYTGYFCNKITVCGVLALISFLTSFTPQKSHAQTTSLVWRKAFQLIWCIGQIIYCNPYQYYPSH